MLLIFLFTVNKLDIERTEKKGRTKNCKNAKQNVIDTTKYINENDIVINLYNTNCKHSAIHIVNSIFSLFFVH